MTLLGALILGLIVETALPYAGRWARYAWSEGLDEITTSHRLHHRIITTVLAPAVLTQILLLDLIRALRKTMR